MNTKSHKNRIFDEIAREHFKFLELEFGFHLKELKEEEWGFRMLYLSNEVGVKIVYEYREAYIFITLYRLYDGNFIENPTPIKENSELTGFSLDDIISIKQSSAQIKPAYKYSSESEYHDEENGLELYVRAFADNLKKYAKDVLTGDFDIFRKTDPLVKKRTRKLS